MSGQAEKEDSEEYSNAMVLFELDQLENLVHKQEELIGDLEARVQALEEVKVDSSAESFFVFSIQLTGYQICPSQNGFEQLTSGVGSSTNWLTTTAPKLSLLKAVLITTKLATWSPYNVK